MTLKLGEKTDAALVGGTVLAMTRTPIQDATVVVRDGKITAVAPASKTKVPTGVQTVDVSARWVTPGFG